MYIKFPPAMQAFGGEKPGSTRIYTDPSLYAFPLQDKVLNIRCWTGLRLETGFFRTNSLHLGKHKLCTQSFGSNVSYIWIQSKNHVIHQRPWPKPGETYIKSGPFPKPTVPCLSVLRTWEHREKAPSAGIRQSPELPLVWSGRSLRHLRLLPENRRAYSSRFLLSGTVKATI